MVIVVIIEIVDADETVGDKVDDCVTELLDEVDCDGEADFVGDLVCDVVIENVAPPDRVSDFVMELVTVDVPVEDVEIVRDTVEEDARVSVRDNVGVGLVDRENDKEVVKDVEPEVDTDVLSDCDSDSDPDGVCDDETSEDCEPVKLSAPDTMVDGDADVEADALNEPDAQFVVD